jgi:DNA-directed RNA polymerase subunit RPC12/RpoP
MTSNKKKPKGAKEMMNRELLKRSGEIHTIDLSQIEGDGSFQCPKCGTSISPEDETEEVYKIIDTKVVNNELVELVVSCATCKTIIKLTGFQQTAELADE